MEKCYNVTVTKECGLLPALSVDVHIMLTIGNASPWDGYGRAVLGAVSSDQMWGDHILKEFKTSASSSYAVVFTFSSEFVEAVDIPALAVLVSAVSDEWIELTWDNTNSAYLATDADLATYFRDNVGETVHVRFRSGV